MALLCQFQVDPTSFAPGPLAQPNITLTVLNNGTAAVSVTGVDLTLSSMGTPGQSQSPEPLPTGVNQTTAIAAGATAVFGPFAMSRWTAATLNPAAMIPASLTPLTVAGFPQYEVFVGGLIYGSDGSVTAAGPARILVSLATMPARAYLGGNTDFSAFGDSPLTAVVM